MICCLFFFFKQKTAYEMRISDWSSDVCSSDLAGTILVDLLPHGLEGRRIAEDALGVDHNDGRGRRLLGLRLHRHRNGGHEQAEEDKTGPEIGVHWVSELAG